MLTSYPQNQVYWFFFLFNPITGLASFPLWGFFQMLLLVIITTNMHQALTGCQVLVQSSACINLLSCHKNPVRWDLLSLWFHSWRKRGWRGVTVLCELGHITGKWWNWDVSLADWLHILHRKEEGSGTSLGFKIFTLFHSWYIHFCLIGSWVKASGSGGCVGWKLLLL